MITINEWVLWALIGTHVGRFCWDTIQWIRKSRSAKIPFTRAQMRPLAKDLIRCVGEAHWMQSVDAVADWFVKNFKRI